MKEYIVVGVYASEHERFAFPVSAKTPEDAETKAKAEATSELIVAAVIERSTFKIVA
jgi:hypothetical protein